MHKVERQNRGIIRVIGLHNDDGSFDRAFWKNIPPAERLAMVWDMVLEFQEWRKSDGDQSRLQRSVCRIERRRS